MIETLARHVTPKHIPLFIAAISALVLVTVHVFEFGFGYIPCELCLYQRLPWWIALGLGSMATMIVNRRGVLALLFSITALVAIVIGAGIAAYHAGVEYKFWPGPAGCSGAQELAGGLAAAIQNTQTGPVGPACDQVAWSLFGISMAGYNVLLSLTVAALAGLVIWKGLVDNGRRQNP